MPQSQRAGSRRLLPSLWEQGPRRPGTHPKGHTDSSSPLLAGPGRPVEENLLQAPVVPETPWAGREPGHATRGSANPGRCRGVSGPGVGGVCARPETAPHAPPPSRLLSGYLVLRWKGDRQSGIHDSQEGWGALRQVHGQRGFRNTCHGPCARTLRHTRTRLRLSRWLSCPFQPAEKFPPEAQGCSLLRRRCGGTSPLPGPDGKRHRGALRHPGPRPPRTKATPPPPRQLREGGAFAGAGHVPQDPQPGQCHPEAASVAPPSPPKARA